MVNPALITHDIAAEAFLDAFRRRVGLGSGKVSVADLADDRDRENADRDEPPHIHVRRDDSKWRV